MQLKEAYDRVFSDDAVRKEQIKIQANPRDLFKTKIA